MTRSSRNSNRPAPESGQSKAFVEAARELGCDDSEERFVETVRKIAKAGPQYRATKSKTGKGQVK
jgi:hypothetical protein